MFGRGVKKKSDLVPLPNIPLPFLPAAKKDTFLTGLSDPLVTNP